MRSYRIQTIDGTIVVQVKARDRTQAEKRARAALSNAADDRLQIRAAREKEQVGASALFLNCSSCA